MDKNGNDLDGGPADGGSAARRCGGSGGGHQEPSGSDTMLRNREKGKIVFDGVIQMIGDTSLYIGKLLKP